MLQMTEVLTLCEVPSWALQAPEPSSSETKDFLIVHITSFASQQHPFLQHPEEKLRLCLSLLPCRKGCKLVILDEADAMTQDAQNALRRGKPTGSARSWPRSSETIWLLVNYMLSVCVPLHISLYYRNIYPFFIVNEDYFENRFVQFHWTSIQLGWLYGKIDFFQWQIRLCPEWIFVWLLQPQS